MKPAKLFWRPTRTTCQKARDVLAQKGFEIETRDFFKERFNETELRALLKKLKLKPRDVFSIKSPSVKAMKLNVEKLTDDEMLALMLQEPRLMRHPLIVIERKPIVGCDQETLNAL